MNKSLIADFLKAYFLSRTAHSMIRRIAWISLVSLSLSVGSMIIILSVMNSLNERVQGRLLNSEPHLMISVDKDDSGLTDIKKELESVLNLKTIEKHIMVSRQDIILRNWNGRFHGATAMGLNSEDLQWFLDKVQSGGPDSQSFRAQDDEVTIGADLADILGLYPGDTVYLVLPTYLIESGIELPKLQKVKIGATIRSTASDMDMGSIIYNSDHLSGSTLHSNPQRYLQLQIWLLDPDLSEKVKKQIQDLGFSRVETWQERNASIFFALRLEKLMIGVFLTLAVLVAAFSLMMSIALLASQKRRDFILLRLLGFSPNHLRYLLVGLSVSLGGLGIMGGVIMGAACSIYLEIFPISVLPDIYYDSDVSAKLDLPVTLGLMFGGVVLMLLASLSLERLLPNQNLGEALKKK